MFKNDMKREFYGSVNCVWIENTKLKIDYDLSNK